MEYKKKILYRWWLIIPVVIITVAFVSVIGFFNSAASLPGETMVGKRRVVSLTPSLTQSIYYLGAEDQLVGCTSYCEAAKADNKEVVASVMKPNIEKIVSLKPDIVLTSGLIPEKDLETLRRFGIQIETFISPTSFDQICTQFVRLAELLDKKNEAEKIVEDSKAEVALIRRESSLRGEASKPKIFMQIGASPIYTVIPKTFMDDYINFCGGENVGKQLTNGAIGREFVIAQNPDYIFIVTMGILGEEEWAKWTQFPQMSAVANKRISIINSDIACQPTPMTFIETLRLINKQIKE